MFCPSWSFFVILPLWTEIYIYIYMYIYREREERDKESKTEQERKREKASSVPAGAASEAWRSAR